MVDCNEIGVLNKECENAAICVRSTKSTFINMGKAWPERERDRIEK